jgi:hypothetical protein
MSMILNIRRFDMHGFAILIVLALLLLALGVIRDMLVTHAAQIIAALSGERVLPHLIVDVVSFQPRSATARRRDRLHKRAIDAVRPSPLLALAA